MLVDITAQREALQKEHALSVQMKAIMSNLHGGITATVYHDLNKIEILFSNEGFYALYGYTKEQMDAELSNILDLILPEDRDRTMETVARIVRSRGSETYEYRCKKRDGSIMWTQCTNSVISIDGVGDTVLLAVTNDITALRAIEHQAAETSDRLSAVLNHAGNGITARVLGRDAHSFLFANDKYFEIVGYTREAYVQRTAADMFAVVHPDDRESLRDTVIRTNRERGSAEAEYRVIRQDGSTVWIKAVITISSLTGIDEPVQIAVFSDITAEKNANEQLQFLNESAHAILAQPDSEQAVHDTLYRLTNYFAADRAYVVELDYEKGVSTNTYEVCTEGVESELPNLQAVPFSRADYWFEALSHNTHFVVEDVSQLDDRQAELQKLLLAQGIRSLVLAPLWRDGMLIGFIGLDNPAKSASETGRLPALADYIAILLTRRDLNAKLDSEQQMTLALMHDIPGGFVRMKLSPSGAFVPIYVNRGFLNMIGMSSDELHAIYGGDVLAGVVPEDRHIVEEAGRKLLANGSVVSKRFRVRHGSGREMWLIFSGSTTKDYNGEVFLNVYYTDMTDRISEEERQKELLDNLPTGAALYEYDGKNLSVIHINKSYWALVGRKPVDYSEASVLGVVYPEDRETIRQEIGAAIKQMHHIDVMVRILCENGEYRPFRIQAKLTKEENGKYLFFASYIPVSAQTISVQQVISVAMSTMMSASDSLSYLKDKELRYICCSQSIADILGVSSPRELIGKTAYDLFESKYADKFTRDGAEIIASGKPVTGITESIPSANGAIRLVSSSKYPVMDASGNVIGVYCISRDVTAEREKESQLELLTSSIPGGLATYSISENGIRMLYFNDGFFAFSGYSREEYAKIVADDPLAFVHEEDRPGVSAMIHAFVQHKIDGHANGCTYRCRTRDGNYRWMSMKSVLTAIDEERFMVHIIQLDITEQKEAENQQRELLDNLPCGAGLYEFNGERLTTIHVNERYQNMVGRHPQAGEGRAIMDVVHPDDLGRVEAFLKNSADSTNEETPCDARILHADGTYHPYRINSRLLKRDGVKWSSCVTFMPIPANQMTMEQMMPYIFPTMMESSTDLAFAKNKDFRYLCCSHAYARMLGLEDEKEVIGRTDYELFKKHIADHVRASDIALVADGRPIIDKLETIPSESGLPCYIRISKYLLRDTVGDVLGVYGIGRDITERQEASDQLKLLTNTIPGGLATFACTERDYRLEYCNDGFCALFGYSREGLQMPVPVMMKRIYDEDRPMVDAQVETLIKDGTPIDCIYRIRTEDGVCKWISHKAIIVDRVQNAAIVNAVFLDVTEEQEEKERLRVSEELNRLAIEHSGNIITRFDVAARTLTLPDAFNPIFELPHVLCNMPHEQIALGRVSPETAGAYTELFESIVHGSAAGTATYQQNSSKGWRWLEAQYTTVFSHSGEPVSAVISFTDITEKLEKEVVYNKWQQSLAERPEDSYTLFRCNLSRGASYDSWEGKLLKVHFDDAKQTFDERTAEYVAQCVYEGDRERYRAFMNTDSMLASFYRGHRSDKLEYREQLPDGSVRWLMLSVDLVEYPNSREIEVYLMYEDIDKQKRADLMTLERAETDPLTGILNRATFITRMDGILRASGPDEKHALLMLDVDNFKHVNDTLGHGAGDQVLCDLTGQISAILRRDDLIGRLGGDEFFVFLKNVPGPDAVAAKARQICALTIYAQGSDIPVTASIGIAMIPQDGGSFDELYKRVDATLYREKRRGKKGFLFCGDTGENNGA